MKNNNYKSVMVNFSNCDEKDKVLCDKFVSDSELSHRSLSAQIKFILAQYYSSGADAR